MYSQIASNKRRTIGLMAVFVVLVGLIAYAFSWYFNSPGTTVYALVAAIIYAGVSYVGSARMALGLSGARPITKQQAPQLYRIVENLSITAGLPMPQVYIIDDAAPNAFATGRDPKHSYVAVTSGLLDMLTKEELEGVIGHELSHVRNYDIRVMAIVAALVAVIAVLSDIFVRLNFWGGGDDDNNGGPVALIAVIAVMIVAPLVATLVQLAVSRKREFLADASGAELTRYPEGLASALQKIGAYSRPMRKVSSATAHLFIANPFGARARGMAASLLSTHPPIAERVKRLEYMERHG